MLRIVTTSNANCKFVSFTVANRTEIDLMDVYSQHIQSIANVS